MHYDIIGDVHGHASRLEELLKKMGYQKDDHGSYYHDSRQAIFVGDLIDRGCEERSVIEIVRPMVENGSALCVLGNHEFNAICYSIETDEGYLRSHNKRHTKRHEAFLDEYPFGSDEYYDVIEWFKTLPVYLDLDDIGVVHACWCEDSFDVINPFLNEDNSLLDQAYVELCNKTSPLTRSVDLVLKGPEVNPPAGLLQNDFGKDVESIRIKWWSAASEPVSNRLLYYDMRDPSRYEDVVNAHLSIKDEFNAVSKPVFIGHYWMVSRPAPLTGQIACVDSSGCLGGVLAAYRGDGEKRLEPDKFEWV